MKLAVGGDIYSLPLKGPVINFLEDHGHDVTDFGTHEGVEVDFPDITQTVCDEIRSGNIDRAVLVCGTGVGACIAANKIPGIRAALCHDVYLAHQCVEHDDVNVLCLGALIVGNKLVEEILLAFVNATFSTEEHFRRRVAKLADMEKRAASEFSG